VNRVVYFDPDIQLYSSGSGAAAPPADSAEVVLTPHLTAPLADDRQPTDLAIVQSGTYNLGFLALLRRSPQTPVPAAAGGNDKLQPRLRGRHPARPVHRPEVDGPGAGASYEHTCTSSATRAGTSPTGTSAHRARARPMPRPVYTVNGQPLFFFHFSGYGPGSRLISKHQDRFTLDACTPAVQALFAGYERTVAEHGRERFARLPYAFTALADGTVLPDCARQLIRSDIDWTQSLPDFRSVDGARFLIDYLTAPVDAGQPVLSRLALQLYRSREDLRVAFPDVLGTHRHAFAAWFRSRAGEEAKVSGVLLGATTAAAPAAASVDAPEADTSPPHPVVPSPTPPGPPLASLPYRVAYRLAWNARDLLRPLTTPQVRQRVRSYLIKRAYPAQAVAAATAAAAVPVAPATPLPFGVTVVGYVRAESGVGESARATLRALACTALPHAVHDFRDGNVSRMGEDVDAALDTGTRHAISLFHINADQIPHARASLGDRWFGVPYRIGFWAWELEHFPAEWQAAFDLVDEVWVPSTFCQRAVAERSPVPVLCVPHAVAVPERLQPDRARFGLQADSVVFLAMADVMSSPERKNPFGAIDAFVRAFGTRPVGVELVVKVSNGDRDPAAMQRLHRLAAGCSGLHLVDGYLDRSALNSLIDSADVFVSLHRAEGFD
jgi:glycosyltransferase involved in cell wall biosynthesis